MRKLTQEELNEIVRLHGMWLRYEEGGVRANLSGANLIDANLIDANLSGANLSGANLIDANLSGANLSGANLSGANLSCANLSGANLSGANLIDANLSDANLHGSIGNMCETRSMRFGTQSVTHARDTSQIIDNNPAEKN